MKVLVTGGGGFVGSHVVRHLLDDGIDVRVLHLKDENLRNIQGLNVELIEGNLLDVDSLKRAMKDCDVVFHLAALYALWLPRPQLMREVNVDGTRNVMEVARDLGVKQVIHTSSVAAFSGHGLDVDATEDSSFALGHTGDLYCITKYESQKVAEEFMNDLDVRICAPTGPIGPGDIGPTPTGKLILWVTQLPIAIEIHTCNNMADVRDIAKGHVLAMQKGKAGRKYLLGNKNVWQRELADTIMEVTGVQKPVIPIPAFALGVTGIAMELYTEYVSKEAPILTAATQKVSQAGLRADCSRAIEELGLPTRPLSESIRDALVWFAENGHIEDSGARQQLLARLV